jgi:hypothetical protein
MLTKHVVFDPQKVGMYCEANEQKRKINVALTELRRQFVDQFKQFNLDKIKLWVVKLPDGTYSLAVSEADRAKLPTMPLPNGALPWAKFVVQNVTRRSYTFSGGKFVKVHSRVLHFKGQ